MVEAKLIKQLIGHEGLRLEPYKDTVGKLTIGVGRNLDDKGISKDEAIMLLKADIYDAVEDAASLFSNFYELDDIRQRVLVDMAFNLGRDRLSLFKKMIIAVENWDFKGAADEMIDSKWFRQVGIRSINLEQMMRTGEDIEF